MPGSAQWKRPSIEHESKPIQNGFLAPSKTLVKQKKNRAEKLTAFSTTLCATVPSHLGILDHSFDRRCFFVFLDTLLFVMSGNPFFPVMPTLYKATWRYDIAGPICSYIRDSYEPVS